MLQRVILVGLLTSVAVMLAAAPPAAPAPEPQPEGVEERFARAYRDGALLRTGERVRRVWGQAFSSGDSPSESVDRFLRSWSDLWKVPMDQLARVGASPDSTHLVPLMAIPGAEGACGFTLVTYSQQVAGIPVFRSHVWGLVRNEPGFPMVLAGSTLRPVGDFEATLDKASLTPASLKPDQFAREALGRFREAPLMSSPRLVIWAGVDDEILPPRLAVEFIAEGGGHWNPDNHQRMVFLTDPDDGTVLYEESLILHAGVSGTVNGFVTNGPGADACYPETSKPLPYAAVTVGGSTIYADRNGAFTSGDVTGTVSVQPNLSGRYFQIANDSGAVLAVAAQNVAAGGTATFTFNPTPAEQTTAQTNAYREANLVRDFALAVSPSYPQVSTQTSFPVTVNIASTCNAYYSGGTINFYSAGGGCNNTAFNGVVHHEYGHHLVAAGGSGQQQYGEGMSDVMAMLMLDDPRLGVGFQTCATGIRNADNTCQYQASGCSSCGSAIHSCGQLISGCVWDLLELYKAKYPADAITRVAALAVNSIPLHAGQSDIAADITVDFLTLDDNDATIANGTPNYSEIASAFGSHNLPAPTLALLDVQSLDPLPSLAKPNGSTLIRTSVSNLSGSHTGLTRLRWRAGTTGTFSTVAMTGSGGVYAANLPAGTCGTTLQWYVEAEASGGTWVQGSVGTASAPLSSIYAQDAVVLLNDDVEAVRGWVLNQGDTATAGRWVRGNPIGTTAQPENSRSPVNCFFTGQGSVGGSLGEADVDGGRTHLMSPAYDFSDQGAATLEFWYWHSNNTGSTPNEDPLLVQVSRDNGVSWVQMDSINTNNNAWARRSYRLDAFVALSSAMRVRFISLDEGAAGSLVESAIDDIRIEALSCTAALEGDLDGDGTVGASDLGLLLLDFGPCAGCPSDLDASGTVDSGDISFLLLLFS